MVKIILFFILNWSLGYEDSFSVEKSRVILKKNLVAVCKVRTMFILIMVVTRLFVCGAVWG